MSDRLEKAHRSLGDVSKALSKFSDPVVREAVRDLTLTVGLILIELEEKEED